MDDITMDITMDIKKKVNPGKSMDTLWESNMGMENPPIL
jgi:hypothetical protein